MTTMRNLAEQLNTVVESRMNPSEPFATSIRNAWGELGEWASDIEKRLTKGIGYGVRIVGSVGVAKGGGNAVEVVLSFHTLGTLDEEDALEQALSRLQDFTKSTWVQSKRRGKLALVATYDL